MTVFDKEVEIRWADIDANQHLRHSAYADLCAHSRIEWLQAAGFGPQQFKALAFGPVLFRESTEYRREIHLGERITIRLSLAAASPDNGRWTFRHELYKPDGQLAAIHEVTGAWMDLAARKLIPPPAALQSLLAELAHSADFVALPQPTYK
ncbi:acyl-CoA thioesterase [Vogesella oryzae]|uniref:acyl-CoA thioesterase n=1 Tax=Vogesella oryzae TaxID=1735285 RepID=UPI001583754D|nr:acyl-CoA thioesterase [Vogesella oryzae]